MPFVLAALRALRIDGLPPATIRGTYRNDARNRTATMPGVATRARRKQARARIQALKTEYITAGQEQRWQRRNDASRTGCTQREL